MFKKKYIISFIICGVILFICYLVAGIMGEVFNENNSFENAFTTVLSTPFANHFNDFTPIMIILGIVLFEIGWFFLYIKPPIPDNKEKVETKTISESDIKYKQINISSPSDNKKNVEMIIPEGISDINQEEKKEVNASSFGFVISEDILNASGKEDSTVKEKEESKAISSDFSVPLPDDIAAKDIQQELKVDNNESENNAEYNAFSSDVFWELNGEYSPEQIKEMLQLKKYIKDLDVSTLKQTFKASLEPSEIREYIELFYS